MVGARSPAAAALAAFVDRHIDTFTQTSARRSPGSIPPSVARSGRRCREGAVGAVPALFPIWDAKIAIALHRTAGTGRFRPAGATGLEPATLRPPRRLRCSRGAADSSWARRDNQIRVRQRAREASRDSAVTTNAPSTRSKSSSRVDEMAASTAFGRIKHAARKVEGLVTFTGRGSSNPPGRTKAPARAGLSSVSARALARRRSL
jgi:hypothetical protein